MAKEQYEERRFAAKTAKVIEQAIEIMAEYDGEMTLRQLHYQFVARDLHENTMRNYKKLGDILRNARMAGLVDWDLLQDRTRSTVGWSGGYRNAGQAASYLQYRYKEDLWESQSVLVEIWLEKDALSDVISDPASEYRLDYFATKGYPSISEIKKSADKFKRAINNGKKVIILYFSDHDPEGLHMPEQVGEMLDEFGADVEIRRLGLTMDQINQYKPPPSFAKTTSSRLQSYKDATGTNRAWELDALKPSVIQDLIRKEVEPMIDYDAWNAVKESEEYQKTLLVKLGERWEEVQAFLEAEIDENDDDEMESETCPYCDEYVWDCECDDDDDDD